MIFVCNMLLSTDIVFDIPFDLMCDICHIFTLKPRFFAFCLVIANPTIFD